MRDAHYQKADWRTIFIIALPVYLIATAYLLLLGEVNSTLFRIANVAYIALLVWLTARVTSRVLIAEERVPQNKTRLWAQLGVIAVILLLTGLSSSRIPIWSDMVAWFYTLGESILPVEWFGGPGNSVANPVQFFVIPFVLLLVLGAKPTELGFGKGNRVWQVCLVWLTVPVLISGGLLAAGLLPVQTLVRRIIGNTFQNGFFEEFLFRGALQTRLFRLRSSPWMLLVQAVLFGLWHLRANTQAMDGNILAGLAVCIVSQTVSGIAFGYIYQRTKNLIAPSVAHVAMNVLGQSFG